MPVQSFTIADLMPELISGLIKYVPNVYNETFGLSGMAQEARPQDEPKIRVRGKVYKRFIADDIAEGSEAPLIKDAKFTDEMFTAPEYGKGFFITANDLILNSNYLANFNPGAARITTGSAPRLMERARTASLECVDQIKRAADNQVQQLLKTGTIQLSNYQTIDFERDANNSEVIAGATLKWTIANAATMLPFKDMERWVEQVADRGNCGDDEFIVLMSRTAWKAFVNSTAYKDDSNQRRNYKVERVTSVTSGMNRNIPEGAVYRESVLKNTVGIIHIFTYNQTYTNTAGNPVQWLTDDQVYVIATSNIFERQPVRILTMNDLVAISPTMRRVLAAVPSMDGWLVQPEWNKFTSRVMVMGIYRKFLTQMLTPNKTFTATVNS